VYPIIKIISKAYICIILTERTLSWLTSRHLTYFDIVKTSLPSLLLISLVSYIVENVVVGLVVVFVFCISFFKTLFNDCKHTGQKPHKVFYCDIICLPYCGQRLWTYILLSTACLKYFVEYGGVRNRNIFCLLFKLCIRWQEQSIECLNNFTSYNNCHFLPLRSRPT